MNILLILLIFIFLASSVALVLSLYLYFRGSKKVVILDNKSSGGSKYILNKKNLNKSHVVLNKNYTIVIPSSSSKWKGTITISNLQDKTDILDIKSESRVRIVEYNNSTTINDTSSNINANVWNYDKVKGKIAVNNYTANIYFTGGLVNIDIYTTIMPTDPLLS